MAFVQSLLQVFVLIFLLSHTTHSRAVAQTSVLDNDGSATATSFPSIGFSTCCSTITTSGYTTTSCFLNSTSSTSSSSTSSLSSSTLSSSSSTQSSLLPDAVSATALSATSSTTSSTSSSTITSTIAPGASSAESLTVSSSTSSTSISTTIPYNPSQPISLLSGSSLLTTSSSVAIITPIFSQPYTVINPTSYPSFSIPQWNSSSLAQPGSTVSGSQPVNTSAPGTLTSSSFPFNTTTIPPIIPTSSPFNTSLPYPYNSNGSFPTTVPGFGNGTNNGSCPQQYSFDYTPPLGLASVGYGDSYVSACDQALSTYISASSKWLAALQGSSPGSVVTWSGYTQTDTRVSSNYSVSVSTGALNASAAGPSTSDCDGFPRADTASITMWYTNATTSVTTSSAFTTTLGQTSMLPGCTLVEPPVPLGCSIDPPTLNATVPASTVEKPTTTSAPNVTAEVTSMGMGGLQGCTIAASQVQLYYWPVTTTGDPSCGSDGLTWSTVAPGPGPTSVTQPLSFSVNANLNGSTYSNKTMVDSLVMTSPSVYLAVSGLAATDWFPRLGITTTMTYATQNFVVSMLPQDLSSIVHHISGFNGPWQSELQTLVSGTPTSGNTFMMTESAEPYNLFNLQRPIPASAYFFAAATPTYSGPNGIPTDTIIRDDYHAQISVPPQISSIAMASGWDDCSMALGGLYDPPQPIQTSDFIPTGKLTGCHNCAALQPITDEPFTTAHQLPVQVNGPNSFLVDPPTSAAAPIVTTTNGNDPGVQVVNPQLQGPNAPVSFPVNIPASPPAAPTIVNPGPQTNAVIQPQAPAPNTGNANPPPQTQVPAAPSVSAQAAPQVAPAPAPVAVPNGALGLGSNQQSAAAPAAQPQQAAPAPVAQPQQPAANAPAQPQQAAANPPAQPQQAQAAQPQQAANPVAQPQQAAAPPAQPAQPQQAAVPVGQPQQAASNANSAAPAPAPQGNVGSSTGGGAQGASSGQSGDQAAGQVANAGAANAPVSGGSLSGADGPSSNQQSQPGPANVGNVAAPQGQVSGGSSDSSPPAQNPLNAVVPLGPSSSAVAVQAPIVTNGQTQPNAVLIGSNTLIPGGAPATIGNQVVSAGPSGVVVGGTNIPLTSSPANPNVGSVGVLPLSQAAPNQGPVQNQDINLGGSQPIAAQIQQPAQAPGAPPQAPVAALPGGVTAIAGGAPAQISGHAVSLAANGQSLVVDGSVTQAVTGAPFSPGNQANLGPANPNAVQAITTTGRDGIATTGDVVGGTTLLPNGPGAVISGHTLSAASDGGVVVDGSSTARPLGSALSNGAFSLTLGPTSGAPQLVPDQTTSVIGPNGQTTPAQVLAGQTITAGQPAQTISGHQVSVAPNGALMVDSTPASPNPAGMITLAPNAPSQVLPASSAVVTGGNGQPTTEPVIAGQTLVPGGPPQQIQGHTVSVAPNGQLFVDNQPTSAAGGALTVMPSTPPQILSARPTQIIGADGRVTSADVIAGSTLTPGATASISGHVFSIGPSGQIIADGGATVTPNAAGQITVSNNGVMAGQQTIKTGADGKTTLEDIIGGRTLDAGGPPVTISGHVVSLASNGAVVVDGTQSLMPSGAPITQKPLAATFSLGGVSGSVTASPTMVVGADGKLTSADVIGSQTLTAGGSASLINGHTISLASNGNLVVDGTSTVPAAGAGGVSAQATGSGSPASPTRVALAATSSRAAARRLGAERGVIGMGLAVGIAVAVM